MSNENVVVKPSNKLTHYMKAPFRALVRARDMYVNGLGGCASRFERGRVIPASVAVPRSQSRGFHQARSASIGGSGDDVNELIRTASQGRRLSTLKAAAKRNDPTVVPRSQSVAVGVGIGIGRIDEDEPCDFGVGQDLTMMYPRSRSSAVVEKKRRRVGVGAKI